MNRSEINRVLALDNHMRSIELHGTDGLIRYPQEYVNVDADEIKDNYPTIYSERLPFTHDALLHFNELFYTKYPFLQSMNMRNMLIAGGSITSILGGHNVKDLDIFFYGISVDEAETRMHELISEICNHFIDRPRQFVKNRFTVTLRIDNIEFQFILRCYSCISEILHAFDIGSSAIGFDGQQLYTTAIGHFSLTTKTNIIDLKKRSATYEKRLIKYFDRGFSIILPNLDLSKLNGVTVVLLGKLRFEIKSIDQWKINVRYCREYNGSDIDNMEEPLLNYAVTNYREDSINYINIVRLLSNTLDNLIFAGEDLYEMKINTASLIDSYRERMNSIFIGLNRINVNEIKHLNPDMDVEKIIRIILDQRSTIWNEFVDQRCGLLTALISQVVCKNQWIVVPFGNLLSATFMPTINTDPKEWYGEFYC